MQLWIERNKANQFSVLHVTYAPARATHAQTLRSCVSIHKRQENDKEREEVPPSSAHGVSVFLLNRDRTLDEVQAALRHEYKWARSLCCARERSHKLGEAEQHSLSDSFCPEFKISSDSLHSTRAPRGLVHLQYRGTYLCLNTSQWPVRLPINWREKRSRGDAALPDSDWNLLLLSYDLG